MILRTSLLIISLIACLSGYGQTLAGNQQAIKVKVASYGATQNALISLPDDYSSTTEKYPLIIFLHGYGEIGNSTADLSKQLKQGLPAVIAKGVKIQATNPVDGKLYKFIVLSPQHHGWTTEPAAIDYMLKELTKAYRIDTNRFYLTGLSAGGQGVIQAVTYSQTLTSKFAAIVPMSPSAPDNSFIKRFSFFKEGPAAWFFSGKSDPGNYTDNARRYNDSINRYSPGASRLTLYSGGHCCWTGIYDPSFREGGLNIYEWMLTYNRGDVPPVDPPKPPQDTQICIGGANSIRKVIILMKDGSFRELDSAAISVPNVQIELR